MRLARITSRFGDLPDLYTFECRACGASHIELGFSASTAGALQLGACTKDLWTLATSEKPATTLLVTIHAQIATESHLSSEPNK
jgi:hypothetical protein